MHAHVLGPTRESYDSLGATYITLEHAVDRVDVFQLVRGLETARSTMYCCCHGVELPPNLTFLSSAAACCTRDESEKIVDRDQRLSLFVQVHVVISSRQVYLEASLAVGEAGILDLPRRIPSATLVA